MSEFVKLRPTGQDRRLPDRLIGMNTPLTFALPGDDPGTIAPAKELAPGFLRFPGGTVSNFFQWRDGHLVVPLVEGESYLRPTMRGIADVIKERHPGPYTIETFQSVARKLGADVIIVPNLETSTPQEQGAWFEHMRANGVTPTRVEMGNEFFLALMSDPESARRFPNWSTTLDITRTFVHAIRPHLPGSARIAVQSASSLFYTDTPPKSGTLARCWDWDQDMAPEEWFDAVTAHFYPEFDLFAGAGTSDKMPDDLDRLYDALLARADAGMGRALDFLGKRMPGKEIWITEWSAWPLAIGAWLQERPLPDLPPHPAFAPFNAIWLPYIARMLFSMLRRPAVTVILYHALSFRGGVWGLFDERAPGEYVPIGPYELLRWFIDAAHGATYEHIAAEGAQRIDGGTPIAGETYADVEAASFSRGAARTLLVQNASRERRRIDLSAFAGMPTSIEIMLTPDFMTELDHELPPVVSAEVGAKSVLDLPGLALARVRWR